jgi:hypothetical protein
LIILVLRLNLCFLSFTHKEFQISINLIMTTESESLCNKAIEYVSKKGVETLAQLSASFITYIHLFVY